MTKVLLAGLVVGAAGVIAVLVFLARDQRLGKRGVLALTGVCAAGLLVMLISDWPSEELAKFWADHSVLAGLLSTVLLVGVAFLAFEDSERRKEERIDAAVTSTGLGGIVDHVVDVEAALALLGQSGPPRGADWPGWDDPASKPLRWLRHSRDRLSRDVDGGPSARDPRRFLSSLDVGDPGAEWRIALADQCVRRLLAAIRDWAPVIQSSRNGTVLLIAVSDLRRDLMNLSAHLTRAQIPEARALLVDLRVRCRLLAYYFESLSGADPHRGEVLATFSPLPPETRLPWSLDRRQRGRLGREWRDALAQSETALGG